LPCFLKLPYNVVRRHVAPGERKYLVAITAKAGAHPACADSINGRIHGNRIERIDGDSL
jgi:hypothetical protein